MPDEIDYLRVNAESRIIDYTDRKGRPSRVAWACTSQVSNQAKSTLVPTKNYVHVYLQHDEPGG